MFGFKHKKRKSGNLKSVHVTGPFGRGKTHKIMNSTFEELLGSSNADSRKLKYRIRNRGSVEKKFRAKSYSRDVLYFSALGKTHNDLLVEMNYELYKEPWQFIQRKLSIFNFQKVNIANLFNKLENGSKNNVIDIIILDDLERSSDPNQEIELNKIIRLIIELQKNYNVIVVSSQLTTKNTTINILDRKEGRNNYEIEEYLDTNLKLKLFKIKFNAQVYIEYDTSIINNIVLKYLEKIRTEISKKVANEDKYEMYIKNYEAQEKEISGAFLYGDLRAIEQCFSSILNTLKNFTLEEILFITSNNAMVEITELYCNRFNIIYDEYSEDIKERSMRTIMRGAYKKT